MDHENKNQKNGIMGSEIILTKNVIYEFIKKYSKDIDEKYIKIDKIVDDIKATLPEKINMNSFYEYMATYCANKISHHPDYNIIASRICVDRLHMITPDTIFEAVEKLYKNYRNGKHTPLIRHELYELVEKHQEEIEKMINYENDYEFDFFGIKTLEKAYLLGVNENGERKIIERPQHMLMRIALGIHKYNFDLVRESYEAMSKRLFTHATPTLFHCGVNKGQLASCFLLGVGDSIESMYEKQIPQIAYISKNAGGIGMHLSSVRSKGSTIRTGGKSQGIVPYCVVLNKIAKHVNQNGKRPGSIACYLEPHHPDIFEFCELRKNNSGTDDTRARDLFLALWIPDLFWKRVKKNEMWSLMCASKCPGLEDVYGEEYEKLYIQYENEKRYTKQVRAIDLCIHILQCIFESGMPYILNKDNVNRKSNQKNIGTIKSSNLCAEIVEYSDENETAVCNLSSICLPRFIRNIRENEDKKKLIININGKTIDEKLLIKITRIVTRNLNKVIDINYYPVEQGRKSNSKHRPMGIGVQGVADVYNILEIAYDSDEAMLVNKFIFETIYFGALTQSIELAMEDGAYETFEGSPFSEGKLQYHLAGLKNEDLVTSKLYDWDKLCENIKEYGIRNSLLTALMPTAGTSQLMGCYESFEPYMSNIFIRTTQCGEFPIINETLVRKLISIGLWNDMMRKKIVLNKGSIQKISEIPEEIRKVYKTAFEISKKRMIEQASDRQNFIDQSQSMNLFMDNTDVKILLSTLIYGWEKGLKTGMYYCRTTAAVSASSFGIDIDEIKEMTGKTNTLELIGDSYGITVKKENIQSIKSCKRLRKGMKIEDCLMCSS